ncbi:cytochrome P450, partial [Streptomyces sp. NPDC005921]
MNELTDLTEPTTPASADPVAWPQDRTCPYHPPTGYDPLRDGPGLSRITLFDGRPVWAVTGHGTARALLADPRLSRRPVHARGAAQHRPVQLPRPGHHGQQPRADQQP